MARVLVVEDDPTMADVVARALTADGHSPVVCGNGIDALIAASTQEMAAAVLDVMLPEMSGFELCRRLREQDATVPILMITARDAVDDRVRGLDSGADDYLTKPFALPEFSARIRALLRRRDSAPRTRLSFGDIEIDLTSSRVEAAGRPLTLTSRELGLLRALVSESPTAVDRPTLLDEVWGTQHIDPSIVDQYVRYVRRKLEAAGSTTAIATVRGVGYRMEQS
jgi:two-component system, OmpR family, response regulator